MKSLIAELARARGIDNPSRLAVMTQLTYPTAHKVWNGNLEQTRGETLNKIAKALGCKIDDLFKEATNSDK